MGLKSEESQSCETDVILLLETIFSLQMKDMLLHVIVINTLVTLIHLCYTQELCIISVQHPPDNLSHYIQHFY